MLQQRAAGLLLWARQVGDIDRLLHGRRRGSTGDKDNGDGWGWGQILVPVQLSSCSSRSWPGSDYRPYGLQCQFRSQQVSNVSDGLCMVTALHDRATCSMIGHVQWSGVDCVRGIHSITVQHSTRLQQFSHPAVRDLKASGSLDVQRSRQI